MHINEIYNTLVNDPQSDTEAGSAGTAGGVEMDFFNGLEILPL